MNTPHPHLGPAWRKSSYSNGGANCVEGMAFDTGTVAVRDSKDPARPPLHFSSTTYPARPAVSAPRPPPDQWPL
ncbi:DUF397 domain-containing protein [Streptomyces sioyaensis]|uniref:DUF397 domain-containing protein n=1 Tax=Streptomyces sioyaensis TaxID=67364 RepID=UPI003D74328D